MPQPNSIQGRDGTIVIGIPPGATNDEIQATFDKARASGKAGATVAWSDYQSTQTSASATEGASRPALTMEEQIALQKQADTGSVSESPPSQEMPQGGPSTWTPLAPGEAPPSGEEMSTLGGTTEPRVSGEAVADVMGGFVRGAGPYAAGALAGAPFGGPVGSLGGMTSVALGNLVGPLVANITNQAFGTNVQSPRQVWEQFFTELGVADPQTAAGQLIQETTESVMGAVAMGGLSPQAGSMPALDVTKRSMQEILKRIAPQTRDYVGALFGPAGGMAAESLVPEDAPQWVRTAANVGGNIAADVGASSATDLLTAPTTQEAIARRAAQGTPVEPRVQEGLQYAEESGRRVLTSDIQPPPPGNVFTRIADTLPGGRSSLNRAQQAERIEELKSVLGRFGIDDFSDRELSRALDEGVSGNFLRVRQSQLDSLWNQKAQVAEALGDTVIDTTSTKRLLDDEIARLEGYNITELNPVIEKLRRWKAEINATGFDDPNIAGGGRNLESMEVFRRIVGDAYDPDTMGEDAQKIYNRVYLSLRDDIKDTIQNQLGDEAYETWTSANAGLSDLMKDFSEGVVTDILRKPEDLAPGRASQLLFSKDPAEVRRIFNALDDEGKDLAQMAVLVRMAQDATPNLVDISPNEFANLIGKRANELGVVLSEENHQMMKGFKNYLDLTRGAENVTTTGFRNPLTTAGQVGGPGAYRGIGAMLSGGTGLAVSFGSLGLPVLASRIKESPVVRNILLELGEPGSAERKAQLGRQLTRILSSAVRQGDQRDIPSYMDTEPVGE